METRYFDDEQGRNTLAFEVDEKIVATITDGAVYRIAGDDYRATLGDNGSDVLASFQRLPIAQVDDEPSLFLDAEGDLIDDAGNVCAHVADI